MQRAALPALILAGLAGIHPALAQPVEPDPGPGRSLTGRVSQSFVADSNYDLDDPSPGTSYYGDTRFALDYLAESRTRSLGLGLDTGLRPLWRAEEDFEFVVASPSTAYLSYLQEGLDTAVDADLRVRSRQVDASSPIEVIDPGAPPDDLEQGTEDTRELRYDAEVGLVLGTSSPSTYEFRLDGTAWDYSDEIGTSLVPRRQIEGSLLWTLRLTPVFSAALFGSYFHYTADDPTDSELDVAEGEAGLVYQPDENLRIRAGLGYADRHRTGIVDQATGERGTIQDNTGLTARADITFTQRQFSLFGNARLTAAAPETRLSGGLTAVYQLPRTQVIGNVYQNYVGGRGGDEERITGATIGLTREINLVSSVGLDLGYAVQQNQDNPDEPDIERTDLTLSYIHALAANVDAEIGYGFRNRIEDPEDADSHRVFFVIGRDFATGL